MPIDPSMNIAKAANLYNQAQKTGITSNQIPEQSSPDQGQSHFSGLVSSYLDRAHEIGKQSEEMSIKGIQDQANLTDVVTAVSEAEITLQTVVAVRDKVVEAYKEILRMPI